MIRELEFQYFYDPLNTPQEDKIVSELNVGVISIERGFLFSTSMVTSDLLLLLNLFSGVYLMGFYWMMILIKYKLEINIIGIHIYLIVLNLNIH